MNWEVRYLPEILDDFRALDRSQRILVKKVIEKVRTNPLSDTEGGYGKRLGNKDDTQLAEFLKVKLRKAGLRVVYQLVREKDYMVLIVIGAREDDVVYHIALKRIQDHNL